MNTDSITQSRREHSQQNRNPLIPFNPETREIEIPDSPTVADLRLLNMPSPPNPLKLARYLRQVERTLAFSDGRVQSFPHHIQVGVVR